MVSLLAVSNVLAFAYLVSHKKLFIAAAFRKESYRLFRLYTNSAYSQNITLMELDDVNPLRTIVASLFQVKWIQSLDIKILHIDRLPRISPKPMLSSC
jgi:hypothetical protein